MEKEKIERAAIELCTTEGQEEWVKDYGVSCFKDGARWRVNSVWHDDISECKDVKRLIVVEYNNGYVDVLPDIRNLDGVKDLVVRVAYLDDLLPERKEENQ